MINDKACFAVNEESCWRSHVIYILWTHSQPLQEYMTAVVYLK